MLTLFHITFKAMGSPCELKIYCKDEHHAREISQRVRQRIAEVEDKYTRFKPDSITSQINASAGSSKKISIDGETVQLLHYADTLFEQSDGLFDITSGILREIWDFKSNQLPDDKMRLALLDRIGWKKVCLSDNTIELPLAGMQIDFGGFVKEYTTDLISNLCLEKGIHHGLINLGGDLRVIGPHPDETPWRVGIQHPRNAKKPIAFIDVYSGAIATSGDYERYMIIDDKRYCHLLNPKTGNSIQPAFSSVSIAHESCLIAGSFSTLAMLKSEHESLWLEDTGLSFLAIDQNMRLSGTLNSA